METDRHALVLGLGASGEAAAELLLREGWSVWVADASDAAPVQERADRLRDKGAHALPGAADVPDAAFDIAVVSPGIASNTPWFEELTRREIPAISEIELGWLHRTRHGGRASKVVAVTGSNGKSTVVKWLVEALCADGQRAAPAGNYGPPLSRVVAGEDPLDWLVVEVSSFQLETVDAFRPEVGVLLNCYPNHLDRHGSMDNYLGLKARLFSRTGKEDVCIVPGDLLGEVRERSGGQGRWVTFGVGADADYVFRDDLVSGPDGDAMPVGGTLFEGDALGLNAAAGMAALAACGVPLEQAVAAARNLTGLPHRLAGAGRKGGVRFVNDSKATNLAGLIAGVRSVDAPVRLIAGGLSKERDFDAAKEVLAERVTEVYLIGEAATVLHNAWCDVVPCHRCGTLETAVSRASKDAGAGGTVLLSPGCASFDQFKSFRERGEQFEALVNHTVEEERTCAGR